ncbi:MAG: DUF1887 family protein [Firmicutes bacterium]|nr:DUF1887 family protein [Bacillota bacterium]
MIQIDFFDKDIVSTLLPIKTMQPEGVFFLTDKRMTGSREIRQVQEAIRDILPETEVEFRPVNIDDLENIYGELKTLIEAVGSEIGCIDLTGGTELMTIAGFRAASEYGILPIYVDVRREHVINALTGEQLADCRHVTLDECLTAVGAKRLTASHDLPEPEEYERITSMAELLIDHVEAWQELYQHLANSVNGQNASMTARIVKGFGKYTNQVLNLCDAFSTYGFWTQVEDQAYRFNSLKYKRYMTNFGIWLEMYVYIKALRVFDGAELGVVIDWNEADRVDTEDNEIDVLVMRRSIPIFISCKMRKPVSADLYEVGYLAERLGGERARALLATSFPVKELGTSPKRMYNRMKKLKVGLIEASSFREMPASDVFNQAVQMTD